MKGVFEGLLGKDMFTGERLAGWERALGVAGLFGAGLLSKFVHAGKDTKAFAPIGEALTRSSKGKPGRTAEAVAATCGLRNSFAATTPVRTLSGLVAISALTIGTPVLAYNEQTGENGYYPITAVHRNMDPAITYLALQDPEQSGKLEYVETTPEHPFYVKEWSDDGKRPKPVGHEDLGKNWVGAGHLQVGDKIQQADGTTGVVANVLTLQQTRGMFNLTVDEAHTFYVGADGWLVHNGSGTTPKTANPKPWEITKWSQKAQGGPFNAGYYKDPNTGLWWSKDMKNDGGSAWKVFEEKGGKLIWRADADQYGNFMLDKYKGPVGKEINLKGMKMSGSGTGSITSVVDLPCR